MSYKINLFLTLGDIADSVVKALTAQQRSLDSLVKIVLDNRIGFYPILFKLLSKLSAIYLD